MQVRSEKGTSLSASMMFVLLISSSTVAQALGVHAHVAPIRTQGALQGGYSQPAGTPQFNVPNGTWNLGEGFVAGSTADADVGGYLGAADPGVDAGDIFHVNETLGGQTGWLPFTWTDPADGTTHTMQRFVGYLRPGQLGPYPAPPPNGPWTIEDAAFELFAPTDPAPTDKLVVVLSLWATTTRLAIQNGGRFAYPGRLRPDGLVSKNPASTTFPDTEIDRHGWGAPDATAYAPAGYAVISGYIVTRTFGRPEPFALQRIRELRRAIQLMLAPGHRYHPDPFGGASGFPCMVMGGSFGGLTAQVLCVPHPAELHAWTAGEEGFPADLELVDAPSGGGRVVVGIYHSNLQQVQSPATTQLPIRVFDALTMRPASLASHGIAAGLGWKELATEVASKGLDLAPMRSASGALAGFVVLTGDRIAWVPLTGQPVQLAGYKLAGFPPADGALALATADLSTRAGGETYRDEIVLSTLSGHVVWFHLEDMLASSNEYLSLSAVPTPPSTAVIPHTNVTLAGTWGLVAHDEGAGPRLFATGQAGVLYEVDPITGAAIARRAHFREAGGVVGPTIREPGAVTTPVRDLILLGAGVNSTAVGSEWSRISSPSPTAWWLETQPWQNLTGDILRPIFAKVEILGWNTPTRMPIESGFVPLVGGGAMRSLAAGAEVHLWGGSPSTESNLVQGFTTSSTTVLDSWYSTRGHPVTWNGTGSLPATIPPSPSFFGRLATEGKDLRNAVRQTLDQSYQHQSLRVAGDAYGTVVVASTPGGSVVLLRPGSNSGTTTNGYGTILWDSRDHGTWPLDDGLGAVGLAVRPVPGSTDLDIFVGILVSHLDPAPALAGTGPGKLAGGIRWLRWSGTSATSGSMTVIGSFLHLDPGVGGDARGGFGVCGLAIGDVSPEPAGDELVATTLEGDLYVFSIPSSGGLTHSDLVYRTWARGALGVCNSILIDDLDGDSKNEVYAAGSQGIWKWRRP